jgi:phage tail sheath protein FI
VTLLGATATGFSVISDVTTSRDPTYRLAHANRLMASLVRALREIGEGATFEPSNARLWLSLRTSAEDVLTAFYRAGALVGATPKDAFSVACDGSTTSQDDIDNGRVIVQVTLSLAVSIQRLDVVITQHGGAAMQGQAA